MSVRGDRMIRSAPGYYLFSQVFTQVQEAIAAELTVAESKIDDLKNQLYVATATWGLKYWEAPLKIPIVEADSYDIRRSRVLSKLRGLSAQFNAGMVKNICEAFSNGAVDVSFNAATSIVKITFTGTAGIPPNLEDLKYAVENIVHAHLGLEYKFLYTTWDKLDAQALTFDQLDTYTWGQIEIAFID